MKCKTKNKRARRYEVITVVERMALDDSNCAATTKCNICSKRTHPKKAVAVLVKIACDANWNFVYPSFVHRAFVVASLAQLEFVINSRQGKRA